MEELLDRGHEVTSVLFDEANLKNANYTEILVPNAGEQIALEINNILMKQDRWNITTFGSLWDALKQTPEVTVRALRDDKFKDFLKSERKVDLIVSGMSIGAFLADHFDCPIALFSPMGLSSFNMVGTGIDINLSIQPPITGPPNMIEPMTFLERVKNHIKFRVEVFFVEWFLSLVVDYQREEWGSVMIRDPISIMRDRFSVIVSTSHPITHGPWPYPPNVIECGGLHLKDPQPLPTDLMNFMDSSAKGVVYVSFGSAIKPSLMPEERVSIFLEAFKKIDLSVVWKWDSQIPNLPSNVMISSWVPQQDLLAHPNLKVFVTHGGIGSIMESIYHKATIVGIPLANDHMPNLLRAVRHGYARILDWGTLSADQLANAINEGIRDGEMNSALEVIHNMYVDNMQRPVESAAWWLEYVCRHKGAGILQPSVGKDIPWYQFHHMDIVIFIFAIFSLICSASVLSCTLCCRMCLKTKVKTE